MILRKREKILLILVGIAAAVWLFDRFYYFPKSSQISKLKAEIRAADAKVNEYMLLAQGIEATEIEVSRLENILKMLRDRTLKGEEFRAFLKHLARESDPSQLKIISLVPKDENLPLPGGKQEISSLPARRVSVQMVLHSTYQKLGTYLKGLEELPFLVSVDHLQIEKQDEIPRWLKVTLGLSMYLAGNE